MSTNTLFVDFSVCVKPMGVMSESPLSLSYTVKGKEQVLKSDKSGNLLMPPGDDLLAMQLALVSAIDSGDNVFLEMGSGADAFCVACRHNGANVFRVPPRRLKLYMEDQEIPEVTIALRSLAESDFDSFYPLVDQAEDVAALAAIVQTFYYLQKGLRIPLEQKLLGIERASAFLYGNESESVSTDLPEMITEFTKRRKRGEERRRDQLFAELLHEVAEIQEADWLARMERATDESRFIAMYVKSIFGVGPRISGRIIAATSDVRRFPTVGDFVSYLGYDVHLDNDGVPFAPRKRKGEELGFKYLGQQGVWNWMEYIMKYPDSEPGAILRSRIEWMKKKYPDRAPFKIIKDSKRYMGQCLTTYIYHSWRHYLGLREDSSQPWRGWDLLELAGDESALFARWGG